MTRATVRYKHGQYVSGNTTIPTARIREYDRRRLRDNAGQPLTVDLLGGRAIKKTYSVRNPRK